MKTADCPAKNSLREKIASFSRMAKFGLAVSFLAVIGGQSVNAVEWLGGPNGNWSNNLSNGGGWASFTSPNSVGANATYGVLGGANVHIDQNISGGVTLGTLSTGPLLNPSAVWTINNTNGITFHRDNGSLSATISNGNVGVGANGLVISGGTMTLADKLIINNSSNSTRTAGAVEIGSAIVGTNVADTVTIDDVGGGDVVFSGGTANTYVGNTIVQEGTLRLQKTAGVNAIAGGNVTVENGGTLLLANANQIANGTTMTLQSGSIFNTGAYSETLGSLSMSGNSIIDMASGSSVVAFGNSSAQAWSGTLSVYNWTGTAFTGGGTDQLFFGTDNSGLTSTQLSQINFYSDSGTTFVGHADWATAGGGQITAVPEPSTVVVGMLLLGMLGWRERKLVFRTRQARATA